jgi:hypothetical protein
MTNLVLPAAPARPFITYTPLATDIPEIRLLTLEASVDEKAPIRCTLRKVNLDCDHDFKALSYVWGDPTDKTEIIVDDCSFMATTNLFSALHHIRPSCGKMVIWIDAVCESILGPPKWGPDGPFPFVREGSDWIESPLTRPPGINQDHPAERSSQVQLMKLIYSKAVEVIAWLGPDIDGGGEALRMFKRLSITLKHYPDDFQWLKCVLGYRDNIPTVSVSTLPWHHIRSLLERPFWHRVWIFQEVVLARTLTLVCGCERLQFSDSQAEVGNRIRILAGGSKPSWLSSDIFSILLTTHWTTWSRFHIFRKAQKQRSMETSNSQGVFACHSLVAGTVAMSATDPRDKVYGLLGIAASPSIVPDYSKTSSEVYLQHASWWLRLGTLEFLYYADIVSNLASDAHFEALPSWVPNWHAISQLRTDGPMLSPVYYQQSHADKGFLQSTHSPLVDGKILRLQGLIVDIIATVQPPRSLIDSENHSDHLLPLLRNVAEVFQPANHPSNLTAFQALLLVFLMGLDPLERNEVRLHTESQSFLRLATTFLCVAMGNASGTSPTNAFNKLKPLLKLRDEQTLIDLFFKNETDSWKGVMDSLKPDDIIKIGRKNVDTLFWRSAVVLKRRLIFFTKNGRLGLGATHIAKGDIVTVVKGCNVPIILRKVGTHFTFISTCYIPGIMDGEAVVGRENEIVDIEIH